MTRDVQTIALPFVTVGGLTLATPEPSNDHPLLAFHIDLDVDQPDMCLLTVNNVSGISNEIKLGDSVDVNVGGKGAGEKFIFRGEVVAFEPIYRPSEKKTATGGSTLLIRAYSRLHRLLRGRYSETWLDKLDSDIVKEIAGKGRNQLTPKVEATKITHEHVYQHNQTDLEFLRILAARNGFEIVVEDKTLHFRKPINERSNVTLEVRRDEAEDDEIPRGAFRVRQFHAKLSSAGLVNEVEVRGWDPEKKKEIVGKAKAESDGLGGTLGTAAAGAFGQTVTYTVDRPIKDEDEAKVLARARVRELLMSYVTADVRCDCAEKELLATIKAGMVLKIQIHPKQPDRFTGMYKVMGVSHRYAPAGPAGSGQEGGYHVMVRANRDAEGS